MTTRPPLPHARSDGSRQWRHRDITTQLRWVVETLGELEIRLPITLDRVTDWTASPFRGAGDGTGRRGSDKSDPTFSAEEAKRNLGDPIAADMVIFLEALLRLGPLVESMLRAHGNLQVVEVGDSTAAFIHRTPGAGTCANPHCQRYVPGGQDRLRRGRCRECYVYLGRTDRERPQELCWPALNEDGAA